jgi:hypothetical protein
VDATNWIKYSVSINIIWVDHLALTTISISSFSFSSSHEMVLEID